MSTAAVTPLRRDVPRRLGQVLRPVAGESFASWIDRYAHDNALPAGEAALVLGLDHRPDTMAVRPRYFGLVLAPEVLARIARRTGIAARVFEQMQLARFDGTALDLSGMDFEREASVIALAQREWALFNASRACPLCLADSPVWPLWWRLGFAAVCPVHEVFLTDVCPGCGIALRRGAIGHPRPLSRRDPVRLGVCGSTLGHGARCEQRLAEIPAQPAPTGVIAAQRQVLEIAHGAPVKIAGSTAAAADYFAALRYLTAMIRCAYGFADLGRYGFVSTAMDDALETEWQTWRDRRSGAGQTLRAMPASARTAAVMITVSAPILAAPDPAACKGLLEPLAAAMAGQRRSARRNALREIPCPRVLGALEFNLRTPTNRVAGALADPPLRRTVSLSFRNVPHLADAGDYAQLLAPFLPGTAEPSGRRLAALSIARFIGSRSWPKAAEDLSMHWESARRVTDTVLQRITDPPGYWGAIDAMTARIEARPRIDYRGWFNALRELREVPYDVLYQVCHPMGANVTPARRRHAAAWIWARLTGCDIREAPAYEHHWNAIDASIREGYHQFELWLPPEVAAVVEKYARQTLEG